MNVIDIIEMSINNSKAVLKLAKERGSQLPTDHAELDVIHQVIKDNQRFITEQEQTLTLMAEGYI